MTSGGNGADGRKRKGGSTGKLGKNEGEVKGRVKEGGEQYVTLGMHLCSACNRRTANALDDVDDEVWGYVTLP